MLPWSPLPLLASFLLLCHLSGSSPPSWLSSSTLSADREGCGYPSSSLLVCGGHYINVSYPFRRSEDKDDCGGTPIFCSRDDQLPGHRIVINSIEYLVKEINYKKRKLRLLNSALLAMSCPPSPWIKTTLDISPFRYTDQDEQLNIYYNCSYQMAGLDLHGLQCPMDRVVVFAYYTTKYTRSYQPECMATIRAALLRSAIDKLSDSGSSIAELLEAMWEGFEVTWAE